MLLHISRSMFGFLSSCTKYRPALLLTMAKSALFGHPPNIEHDYEVIKAIGRVGGIYLGKLDPSKGLPIYAAPSGSPDPWCGRPNLIANIFVLVFVVILTGARLMLWAFCRELKLGWDDLAIIPATAMFVLYFHVTDHVSQGTCGTSHWYKYIRGHVLVQQRRLPQHSILLHDNCVG